MNSRGVLFFCATGEGRWLMSDAEVRLAENETRLGSDQLAVLAAVIASRRGSSSTYITDLQLLGLL
jgi:hypothetical protein